MLLQSDDQNSADAAMNGSEHARKRMKILTTSHHFKLFEPSVVGRQRAAFYLPLCLD